MKTIASSRNRNPESVHFPYALFEQMQREARAAPDMEICGLIAARRGMPVRCMAIRNVATEAWHRFHMDPQQQIAAFRHMREQGEELFGIYHSHPTGPAEPSATDIAEAAYPEALQLILSLQGETGFEVRAYRLHNGNAVPVSLQIEPRTG